MLLLTTVVMSVGPMSLCVMRLVTERMVDQWVLGMIYTLSNDISVQVEPPPCQF